MVLVVVVLMAVTPQLQYLLQMEYHQTFKEVLVVVDLVVVAAVVVQVVPVLVQEMVVMVL